MEVKALCLDPNAYGEFMRGNQAAIALIESADLTEFMTSPYVAVAASKEWRS